MPQINYQKSPEYVETKYGRYDTALQMYVEPAREPSVPWLRKVRADLAKRLACDPLVPMKDGTLVPRFIGPSTGDLAE